MSKIIYAGTYTKKTSKGIYRFELDEDNLKNCELFTEIKNPKYIGQYQDKLVTICEFDLGAGVALINSKGKIIDQLDYEDTSSCYLTVKDNIIYTANYHEGTFSLIEIVNDKLVLKNKILIQEKAGCHQIIFYNDLLLVPCLFLDKVLIFDKDLNKINEIVFPLTSGPRHGVIKGHYLYIVGELSNELYVVDMDSLAIVNSLKVLGDEKDLNGTAAIRLKDNFLYISTRIRNVITVVQIDNEKIKLRQLIESGGDHPRDIAIVDDYVLCANMNTNNVVCFRINEKGLLTRKICELEVPETISLMGM